jgi:protein gp37
MNKTKIEWTDYSWNPVTGCKHGCWYCYANKLFTRFHKSFEPCFYRERLKEPYKLKKLSKIFVCSVADLFAPWTPREWWGEVFDSMLWCPIKHTFQMLTKNPELINLKGMSPKYPDNWWFGTTVTTENGDIRNIEAIKKVDGNHFVSFEPLLGALPKETSLKGIDWIIIGKLTGSRKVELDPIWVERIVREAVALDIPIFLKNNLLKAFPFPRLQEFPEGMRHEHD